MTEIKGLPELNKKLKKLKGIKTGKALLAGAYTLQRYSMENAPVDTGFLRQSHESAEVENGAEMRVTANYAIFQEFGTEKMPANAFVRRSIDENSEDIVKAVANQIDKDIGEESK